MLTTLMMSSAMALTCDPNDIACNTANALRDQVNALRPNSIGDGMNGKRNTTFLRHKLDQLIPIAEQSGCFPDGISAVHIQNGTFVAGSWIDLDFFTQIPTGAAGTYTGGLTPGPSKFSGLWDLGTLGDWGAYDFPTGKMAGLRSDGGPGEGVVVGGIARINSRNAVAWGIHGSCGPGSDVAALFEPYMPQLSRFVAAPPNLGECSFDVTQAQGGPATFGDCPCVDQVCGVDDFCCDTEWDGICAGEAVNMCF